MKMLLISIYLIYVECTKYPGLSETCLKVCKMLDYSQYELEKHECYCIISDQNIFEKYYILDAIKLYEYRNNRTPFMSRQYF
jgi:hypothetical protein